MISAMTIKERRRRFCVGNYPKDEYGVQLQMSTYLNRFYPDVYYKVDVLGELLTKRALVKSKKVNKSKGWTDTDIFNQPPCLSFTGLHIELKKDGETLFLKRDQKIGNILEYAKVKGRFIHVAGKKVILKRDRIRKAGDYKNLHLETQANRHCELRKCGRAAGFGVGLLNCLKVIDGYLNSDFDLMGEGFGKSQKIISQ